MHSILPINNYEENPCFSIAIEKSVVPIQKVLHNLFFKIVDSSVNS